MSKIDINIDKNYIFPSDLNVVNYNNKIIIIAKLTANWIVLENLSQLDVFNYLAKGKSIREAIDNSTFDNNDVNFVITQIEAKQFCSKIVRSSTKENQNLHLYLTNKCNLLCSHCYMFSGTVNSNELTTEEVMKLISDYHTKAYGKYLTLSGGEPSLHLDFDVIVKNASELGLKVKVLTNGALFSNDRVKYLSKYIYSVQVSIDGYSEESNATIRGKGHFSKALSTVESFISYGVETSIAVTPSLELLKSHLNDYITFAKDLLAKYEGKPFEIKFAEGLSAGRNINPTKSLNEEYAALIKQIHDIIYDNQYDLIMFVDTMTNNVIIDNCMFGNLTVSSNGEVYFCPEIGNLVPVANVRTTPIEVILEKCLEARNATMVTQLSPCNMCELLYICGGGCRTENFPNLAKRKSFDSNEDLSTSARECLQTIKEKFYRLMIESNEYLYTPYEED